MKTEHWRYPAKNNARRVQAIFRVVAGAFGLSPRAMLCRSRMQPNCWARQIAFALCYESGMTLSAIGVLTGRNHGTVLHAVQTVRDLSATNPRLAAELDRIRKKATRTIQEPCIPRLATLCHLGDQNGS